MTRSYAAARKPDGLTGAQRAAARLAAKAEANATFYRGIPQIGAGSPYKGDLRQFRRREDRKAVKRSPVVAQRVADAALARATTSPA